MKDTLTAHLPISLKLGLPLWNHLGLFVTNWIVVVIPALFEDGVETRGAGSQTPAVV